MPSGKKVEYENWYENAKKNVDKITGEQCVHFKYKDYKWAYGPCACFSKAEIEKLEKEEKERLSCNSIFVKELFYTYRKCFKIVTFCPKKVYKKLVYKKLNSKTKF